MATDTREPERAERRPGFWNIWTVLSLLAALFTIGVAIAEYLGVFRDLGLVFGAIGVVATIWLGIPAASQRTVDALRFDFRSVRRDLDRGFDQVTQSQAETNRQLSGIDRRLEEITSLLRERLPRQ
jgi:hypothetical protein